MVELYTNKKIVTKQTFDAKVRGQLVGVNRFVVTFMNHGTDSLNVSIRVLDNTNDDIIYLKNVSILLSYEDANVAQQDMEKFITAIWNNNHEIFDAEGKDIKYMCGKRPTEDIKYITEPYCIIKTKSQGSYAFNMYDYEDNITGRYLCRSSRRGNDRSLLDMDDDIVPIYRQQDMLLEIFDDISLCMGSMAANEIMNHALRHPEDIIEKFFIIDGKISQDGNLNVKKDK